MAESKKIDQLIKDIEVMSIAEVAQLVKTLEERWGVQAIAAAPVGAQGASASAEATADKEEKTAYTVILSDAGAQKIAVIKAVREVRSDLGLKEAKDLVDGAPKELLKDVKLQEAEQAKQKLEAAGGKVELR